MLISYRQQKREVQVLIYIYYKMCILLGLALEYYLLMEDTKGAAKLIFNYTLISPNWGYLKFNWRIYSRTSLFSSCAFPYFDELQCMYIFCILGEKNSLTMCVVLLMTWYTNWDVSLIVEYSSLIYCSIVECIFCWWFILEHYLNCLTCFHPDINIYI